MRAEFLENGEDTPTRLFDFSRGLTPDQLAHYHPEDAIASTSGLENSANSWENARRSNTHPELFRSDSPTIMSLDSPWLHPEATYDPSVDYSDSYADSVRMSEDLAYASGREEYLDHLRDESLAEIRGNHPDQLGDETKAVLLTPAPGIGFDFLVSQAVVIIAGQEAELYSTYSNPQGTLYVERSPLFLHDYANPTAQEAQRDALKVAIESRAAELGCSSELAFPPVFIPNPAVAQLRASRVEHRASIRRPDTAPSVWSDDQPTRKKQDIACLTAQINIGGTLAYVLFDSGSNTDSITPEFAAGIKATRIPLKDQVTLQLGCVGSRSRISNGARTGVDFGGIKGNVYFDQVNLDRYDGIIGTPFMNKHGLILDFGAREVRFPNGRVIAALSSLSETALVNSRAPPHPIPRIAPHTAGAPAP
jgi:hypothetical protein